MRNWGKAGKLASAVVLAGAAACSSSSRNEEAAGVQRQAIVTTPVTFSVTGPSGTSPSITLLSASHQLTLNGTGTVGDAARLGTVAGFGTGVPLIIQAGAKIYANPYSSSPVTVSLSATVYGSASSRGLVTVQKGASVFGVPTKNKHPASTVVSWVADWPTTNAGPIDLQAAPALPPVGAPGTTYAPGAYSTVNIRSPNRVTLGTGTYFFDSFNLEPSADSASGPILLYVKTSFRDQGKLLPKMDSSGKALVKEGAFRFAYAGTTTTDITAPFVGVLVAPNASTALNAPSSGQQKCAFFGKSLTVVSNGGAPLLPLDFTFGDFTPRGGPMAPPLDPDHDGADSRTDLCPQSSAKTEPGVCGCRYPDTDANGDKIPDSIASTPGVCTGKSVGTPCRSAICPSGTATSTVTNSCVAGGECSNPVNECAWWRRVDGAGEHGATEPQSGPRFLRHRGEPTEPPRAPPRDPPYFETLVV